MNSSNVVTNKKFSPILIRTVLLVLAIGMTAASTAKSNTTDSYVAVSLERGACLNSNGGFIALPDNSQSSVTLDFLDKVLTEKFGQECKLTGLFINGRITEHTYGQLELGLQLLDKRRTTKTIGGNTLWLNSKGGLIDEGMKIGDLIAANGMGAIVAFGGYCYSACVLVYASAKTRGGVGEIGIHRPFATEISTKSLSYTDYLKQYESLTPLMKSYFLKYGVSPAIVDAMNVVPSDSIKILTDSELESYGLGVENVAAKEFDKARTIEICGKDFHELDLKFFALIRSCRQKMGISVLDQRDEICWDLAHQAYPNFDKETDACFAKLGKKR